MVLENCGGMSILDVWLLEVYEWDDKFVFVVFYIEVVDIVFEEEVQVFYLINVYVFVLDIGVFEIMSL